MVPMSSYFFSKLKFVFWFIWNFWGHKYCCLKLQLKWIVRGANPQNLLKTVKLFIKNMLKFEEKVVWEGCDDDPGQDGLGGCDKYAHYLGGWNGYWGSWTWVIKLWVVVGETPWHYAVIWIKTSLGTSLGTSVNIKKIWSGKVLAQIFCCCIFQLLLKKINQD